MLTRIGDLSFVFISFHEPQAEAHWQSLRRLVPTAVRVDGVKGFVSAHKAAGRAATTERFVTVDADCRIDRRLLDHHLSDDALDSDKILSWHTRNNVNGLAYGGAVKCWTRSMLAAWHEADATHLDLDVAFDFIIQARVFGTHHINGSPLQAYRSGFREGVRLGLVGGEPVGLRHLATALWPNNWRRLVAWCTIGSDVSFGQWCVWGAREGCLMAQSGTLDRTLLADYDHFADYFAEAVEPRFDTLDAAVRAAGERLRDGGMALPELAPQESAFFREHLAERANPEAFDMLGNQFGAGDGLPRHPGKAFAGYLTGALLGSSNAMNNLARCYREGRGVVADPRAAQNWLLHAAALENPWALLRLGRTAMAAGDHAAAVGWLERAADTGNRDATALLQTVMAARRGRGAR